MQVTLSPQIDTFYHNWLVIPAPSLRRAGFFIESLIEIHSLKLRLIQTTSMISKKAKVVITVCLLLSAFVAAQAENGYQLWLRYKPVSNPALVKQYRAVCSSYLINGNSPTIMVIQKELVEGLQGLLNKPVPAVSAVEQQGVIIIGTAKNFGIVAGLNLGERLKKIGRDGYLIVTTLVRQKKCTIITANEDIGLLYGVFHFLRQMQTGQDINNLSIVSFPKVAHRILNHWGNPDGSIERGYAGRSIWNWQDLPRKISPRYQDYARANAAVGINGTVLNNVNADPKILSKDYLFKVKALADVFRPYGIKVYLSAAFSAPAKLGGLKTADPLDPVVIAWWQNKVKEIYHLIPDFGGLCVKANSEGQPGPQDYGRTHLDGANMLADVLAPYQGILMWRAFVYHNSPGQDRTKQAYNEFKPLDGKFRPNVLLQVKNGPIDFQPIEPFHPLYGAMPQTPLMLELQVTKEYIGFATHLVFLATLFTEALHSDTYAHGAGSTIASIVGGKADGHHLTGMAGVANIGNDTNWCHHPFDQANWYAFGRLSWDPDLSAAQIADDWIKQTFTTDPKFLIPVSRMMLSSLETARDYFAPMGLTMLMDESHFRPAPWRRDKLAPAGTRESFHKADSSGIGFDRTSSGSNATGQYAPEVNALFTNLNTCPEPLLLWFHHLDWNYKTKSGRDLWDELCTHYYKGTDAVKQMRKTWESINGLIDKERFEQVRNLLAKQEEEAIIWRNSCILYFQTFSRRPIPRQFEPPAQSLMYYKQLRYRYKL